MAVSSSHHLRGVGSRTEKEYVIPIHGNNIRAEDIKNIAIPNRNDSNKAQGLNILDNNFKNTACKLPTEYELEALRHDIGMAANPPKSVVETIHAFPLFLHAPPQAQNQVQSLTSYLPVYSTDAETFPILIADLSAFMAADKDAASSRRDPNPMYRDNLKLADEALCRTIGYLSATVAAAILRAGSILTAPTPCIIAGLIPAYGSLHSSSSEINPVYDTLDKIKHPKNVPAYIEMVKQKKAKLYGYVKSTYNKTTDL
ncbi:hypothetical protein B0H63DRAFT_446199 [Podospora didyma]|uniref:Uncharacterized protein n=1 Tax=Podospora didyma TaxID=330526 RepID=A0AAE0NYM3_9PEZI|nr:hypothetical protein B0H63DRAFT_446199 [Podospora didyma]